MKQKTEEQFKREIRRLKRELLESQKENRRLEIVIHNLNEITNDLKKEIEACEEKIEQLS